MTAVGKILVFFNLAFSIVISAMIVLVYSTRTNWKTEYENLKAEAQLRKSQYDSDLKVAQERVAARDVDVNNLAGTIAGLQTQVRDLDAEVARLQTEKRDALALKDAEQSTNQALVKEMERIKAERDDLKTRAEQQRNQIVNLTGQLNDQRQVATRNQLLYESTAEKNEKLLEMNSQLRDDNRQMAFRLRELGGGALAAQPGSVLEPQRPDVPRNATGRVVEFVEPNLLSINIGSDSGVREGAVLDVYRLNPPVYLGEMIVSRADPKQAAGVFRQMRGVRELPKAGDTVGTLVSVTTAGQ